MLRMGHSIHWTGWMTRANSTSCRIITKTRMSHSLDPTLSRDNLLTLCSWLETARKDTATQAGGYFIEEYYNRSLFEAFSGLTFFIDEDSTKKDSENRAPTLTDLMIVDAVS